MTNMHFLLFFFYSLFFSIDPVSNIKSCPEFEIIDSKEFSELFEVTELNDDSILSACWEGGDGWLCESKGCWQMTDELCGTECVTKDGCSVCFICTGNLTPPDKPIEN